MKKGQTHFKFLRPMSNMRRVLMSIEQQHHYRREIEEDTGLKMMEVRRALDNLLYIAAIQRTADRSGVTMWKVEGQQLGGVADCLLGVSSIFTTKNHNVSTKFKA